MKRSADERHKEKSIWKLNYDVLTLTDVLLGVHIHSSSSDWQRPLWVSKHLMCSFICVFHHKPLNFLVSFPFYSYFCVSFLQYFSFPHSLLIYFILLHTSPSLSSFANSPPRLKSHAILIYSEPVTFVSLAHVWCSLYFSLIIVLQMFIFYYNIKLVYAIPEKMLKLELLEVHNLCCCFVHLDLAL